MSEFITRVGGDEYQVIFKTDSVEKYHAVEDFCREIIDHGKPSGWISVKDKLPEKGVPVLVAFYVDIGLGGIRHVDAAIRKEDVFCGGGLKNYRAFPCKVDVTHWMPLPEPPKEDWL